ncbi:MAG: choice-of-anchor X domain-containing protein, partial [Verrucomicrobiales bacterium]|nr:choice-of-anchor X domain-containing protein [Verrucomicrobiales bacterium]
ARLRSNYPQLNARNTVGDYNGVLSNRGERIALAKPDFITTTNALGEVMTNVIHIVVGELTYNQGGRWGQYADGGGSSLELVDPRADPLQPSNWADSDESQKAEWTSAEFTGRLDHGSNEYQPNRLHISLQGAGECLVDEVEIFRVGSTNLLTNGGFETGTVPGATGFVFNGNHSRSAVRETGAFSGARCLHVRAQGDGDTGVNSIRATLATGLTANATATLRAKVRWLAGWPEILFRTRGNWIEMPVRMAVPKNLGTPGLPNSRLVANAGPAIYAVNHAPALPRANQPVVVTCRVSDPDGVASVMLRYRVDPATTPTAVLMRDDGTGGDEIAGDGIYSATISGRAARTLVAFQIEATDAGLPAVTSAFPKLAPEQECLIRWDDPIPFGTFAHYHLWSTTATENARRNALDNTYRDATLVYGHFRVIYNVGFRDKGSPWHGGQGDFALNVPPDDLLLGATERVVASTGNGDSEATAIRSQLAAWLHQQMGVPYLHAHYTRFYRNGTQFRNVTEDLEQPDHDYAERWYPEVGEGDLYKIAMWFEFQDDNRTFGAVSATLERFLTLNNAYKLARYRWNFQRRPNDGMANNYTNVFDLVTAANDTSANYVPRLLNLAEMEQWMRVFSCGWIMGDWDMWSYGVGQNMFLYKPSGVG